MSSSETKYVMDEMSKGIVSIMKIYAEYILTENWNDLKRFEEDQIPALNGNS